jgi:cell division protease FtsH
MPVDSWLPVGFQLPGGERARLAVHEAVEWQICEQQGGGRLLIAKARLWKRWIESGLIGEEVFKTFTFGSDDLHGFSSGVGHVLAPVDQSKAPESKNEALSFVHALRATRKIDSASAVHDSIYVEKLSLLLPTYSLSAHIADDVVLGTWLTGGVPVSVNSFRRLRSLMGWMGASHLQDVIGQAGFKTTEVEKTGRAKEGGGARVPSDQKKFRLAGRPELEQFFNEHVIDLIENQERYKALGIDFLSAIILHGPPGCGKTYAVERLVEYLGWPSFAIEASSIASPYIHETSKKVAEVFDKAMQNAPSVLIIDEMEAFLADRQMGVGSSHHRVEEVAEFLRRIPEAIKNQVLIVAMTNRIEMIDPAIQRRGRFDHVIKVDMASEAEVHALLAKLVDELPLEDDVDVAALAKKLQGRPLSDVAFLVREGARLAARGGRSKISQANLLGALESTGARGEENKPRKIGFIWDEKEKEG